MIAKRTQPEDEAWAGCATWIFCAILGIPCALVGGLIGYLLEIDAWGSAVVGFLIGIVVASGIGTTMFMKSFISLKDLRECLLFAAIMGGINGFASMVILFRISDIPRIFRNTSFSLSYLDYFIGILIIVISTFLFVILAGLIYAVWQRIWIFALPLIVAGGASLGFLIGYGFGFLAEMRASLGISGAIVGLLLAILFAIFLVFAEVFKPAKQT